MMCLLKADTISYLYRVVTFCLRLFYDFFHTFEMITFAFKCFFMYAKGTTYKNMTVYFFIRYCLTMQSYRQNT